MSARFVVGVDGRYVETGEVFGKSEALIKAGGEKIDKPDFDSYPLMGRYLYVVVVTNPSWDAALVIHDHRDYVRCWDETERPTTWIIITRALFNSFEVRK